MALKIVIGVFVTVLLGGIAFGFYSTIQPTSMQNSQTMANSSTSGVTIGSTKVQVEVEDTDAAREQGLSGRSSLADGSGMLFIFDTPGHYGFWMKDMNFSIDMLFADASGKIVTIAANASPAGYQANPPQVFYPAAPAQYVLEVPAGFAAANGIAVGQTMTIER